MKLFRITILAIKYWVQGDDFLHAWRYARAIVVGFKS